MVGFSLPTFVTGLELSHQMTPGDVVQALLYGSLIVVVVGSVMGTVGTRTRLSSYLLVRIAFGDRGAGVVNLAFALSLLGWFGVNINLFSDAVGRLAQDLFGVSVSALWLSIVASVCMTITTIIGFRAINLLSSLLIPVLIVVTFLLLKFGLSAQPLAETMSASGSGGLSVGDGISAVVGAVIIGAIILPDITRFSRQWSGGIYTAVVTYLIIQILVTGSAALAGVVSGKTDILQIMLDVNLGFGAFAIVIAGSWALNSLNLYSAVLGTKATFPSLPTTLLTIALGVVGVGAALMNILDMFVTFLFYLSIVFVPVAGVIMVDFLWARSGSYHAETLRNNAAINVRAFAAWSAGAIVSLLAAESIIPTLSGIAAIDAVLLSAVVYVLLNIGNRSENNETAQ